jgi:hypothetical protein
MTQVQLNQSAAGSNARHALKPAQQAAAAAKGHNTV